MPDDEPLPSRRYTPSEFIDAVRQVAQIAGERIMEVYATDFDVEQKSDQSPLTCADMAAHHTIVDGLKGITPEWSVLSEESAQIPFSERVDWERYWLVDPLDGTREFVKRNGEFTVNIALIDKHRPVLGVIYVPVTGVTYFASVDRGAFKCLPGGEPERISVRNCEQNYMTIAGSRSHGNRMLRDFVARMAQENVNINLMSVGSSLKSCLVAEGKADIYPRFGPTSEWDTAAAQCVLEQAGGKIINMQLRSLRYNTKDSLLNPHFVAIGDTSMNWGHFLKAQRA